MFVITWTIFDKYGEPIQAEGLQVTPCEIKGPNRLFQLDSNARMIGYSEKKQQTSSRAPA